MRLNGIITSVPDHSRPQNEVLNLEIAYNVHVSSSLEARYCFRSISIINAILKTQFLSYRSTHLARVSAEGEGKFLGIKPIDASKEDMETLRQVMDSR